MGPLDSGLQSFQGNLLCSIFADSELGIKRPHFDLTDAIVNVE